MPRLQHKWDPAFVCKVGIMLFAAFMTLLWAQTTHAAIEREEVFLQPGRIHTVELDAPATGIAVTMGETNQVEIQTRERGAWSAWMPLTIDNDSFAWERDSQLIFANNATAVRLRSSEESAVTVHAVSIDRTPSRWEEASGRKLDAQVIVPRWQWGADEDLRVTQRGVREMRRMFEGHDPMLADRIRNCNLQAYYRPDEFKEVNRVFTTEDGKTLTWPQGYSQDVHMVIVHHTAESSAAGTRLSDTDRMRTIYAYHAVSRGWGDIGYNYVIGPNGMIFEGRAGGDYVVGAHAYCNNVGTVGISLMGNFQGGKPTEAQLVALKWLLLHVTDKYGIDPAARVVHHGKSMPTIIGHRDVGQTACPGTFSHELLPQLRLATKDRDVGTSLFSSATPSSSQHEAALMASLEPLSVTMGQRKKVDVQFMNVGLDTWNNKTWLLAQGDPGVYFTEFAPFSYVAGFLQEDSVAPGEIGTFRLNMQGGLSDREGAVTFTLVINNNRRLVGSTAYLPFAIHKSNPQFTPVTQYFPNLHQLGEDLTGTVKILNSGSVPWERDTITEVEFDITGGSGEVSVLHHPEVIPPGGQGAFRVTLQHVDTQGLYERTLTPRFLEGSPMAGNGITVASHAEPIPEIALISENAGPPSVIAESRMLVSAARAQGEELGFESSELHSAAPFGPSYRHAYTESNNTLIEAIAGTELTLSPKEQATIPIRIRAGRDGIVKFQPIASVVRSHPTIVLRDEKSLRLRDTFRSPVSLRRFQTEEVNLLIVAPRQPGEYTFSIGTMQFGLTVQSNSRYTIRKSPPRKLTRRTWTGETTDRNRAELRRLRIKSNAPPPEQRNQNDTYIRIRLGYDQDNAIIASNGPLRIQGIGGAGANIIFADGLVHVNTLQDDCKVSTANGQFHAPVIRMAPGNPEVATTTITTHDRLTNRFRGTIECRVIDGKLTLINDLPMEQYLAGLAEEPDTEPYEKQRAFAIAARSYATFYVVSGQRKFPDKPYDGSDSPAEFQKYGGVYFEEQNPRWVESVKDTAGRVLTWERKVIKAPYFSQDDGNTKSAYAVWGWSHTPYLDSKPDPWCQGLNNWGHGVGMSGCGSEGQANEGKTAEEILEYYYPGTRILPIDKVRE